MRDQQAIDILIEKAEGLTAAAALLSSVAGEQIGVFRLNTWRHRKRVAPGARFIFRAAFNKHCRPHRLPESWLAAPAKAPSNGGLNGRASEGTETRRQGKQKRKATRRQGRRQ